MSAQPHAQPPFPQQPAPSQASPPQGFQQPGQPPHLQPVTPAQPGTVPQGFQPGQAPTQPLHLVPPAPLPPPVARVLSAGDDYPDIMLNTPHTNSYAIQKLMDMVDYMAGKGISDAQIHPDKKTRWLRNGRFEMLENGHPLDKFSQLEILMWLSWSTGNDHDPLGEKGHASVSVEAEVARLRGTFRRSMQGYTATFRLIPGSVPNADAIGVPKHIQALTRRKSGLVLVEGSTGSGKTTLIASLLNKINHESDQHIYTIEDPVEFVHKEVGSSSIVQREIGIHAGSYPLAVEDALRSKPNVILVGELLNPATAKAALHAATTGHLVFTTAHAGSVVEALDSFIGQFTAEEQPQIRHRLAHTLLAVVVQRLIPSKDGRLAAAREVLMSNPNFSELIRAGTTHMIDQQMESNEGSNTMEASVARLLATDLVDEEVAYENVRDKKKLGKEVEVLTAAMGAAEQTETRRDRGRRRA